MQRTIHSTDKAPKAIGPYSQAVEAGGLIFCSGQLPVNPETGELVAGDIAAATAQVLDNLSAVLAAAGLDFSCAVKTTVFLADMDDFSAMNEVYAKYFPVNPPARACVQAAKLPKGVPVEIKLIACRQG